MIFLIQIDSNIDAIKTWMKAISKIGQTKVRGVDFLGLSRTDNSGLDNAKVADYIAESEGKHRKGEPETTLTSRNFFRLTDAQNEEVAQKFAEKADRELQRSAKRVSKIKKKMGAEKRFSAFVKGGASAADKAATQIASESFKAAMDHWREIVVKNIKGNKTTKGPATKVSDAYADQRWIDEGVPKDDVGEATGDLLENFENKKAMKLTR
jgi:hypothetical protein